MKTFLTLACLLLPWTFLAQLGGQYAFPMLDLIYSGRSAGLAGNLITIQDKDISLITANPAALNSSMHKQISLSQSLHAGGINYGQVAYGQQLKNKGRMLAGHVRYVSYGNFQRTDINGTQIGQFNPFEYIVGATLSQPFNQRISAGASINFMGSHLAGYNSFGMSVDLAGMYINADSNFTVTALAQNIGAQFNAYYDQRASLPANFQLGLSYKLPHAPFRFSIVAHHLNKWRIAYDDPNAQSTIDPLTGDTIPPDRPGFGEQLAQHFSYQLEILASKNIHLRAGFNYYRRQAMKVEAKPGAAGLSFGAGFYFKRFTLDYGFSIYSKAGFNHVLTLSADLAKVRK